ncbi:MAG: hypothetical protein CMLOHMNK_02528 [Steroidobacteraceae bacterium]|nr:hypothetical protein [Steroidobacteraceae bacterium]
MDTFLKATLAATLGALGLAACASGPDTIRAADSSLVDHTCIVSTGSHIRRAASECLPVNGRAYSESDIDRTGAVDLARALTLLDPSISVGR